MPETPAVAYLAEGKLYLLQPGQAARPIESQFAQEILDRAERTREKNEWKQEGMGWNFGAGRNRLGVPAAPPAEVRRVRFTGVAGDARAYFYLLDTDYVGGIFEVEQADGYERRLYHRNQFRAADLHRHPGDGRLALSLLSDAGTARLAVTEPDGGRLREVTEGDAADQAPHWTGRGGEIVYQSAGVARDSAGYPIGVGPYGIYRLDLDAGTGGPLLEDEKYDLLLPRRQAGGPLYFIRRPYRGMPKLSPLKVALDVVLFPFRLARAVVHFLNFFSVFFSRKPLITSGGPPRQGPDARSIMLWGKVIDAEKILAKQKGNSSVALVPNDWELIRRSEDGTESVVSRGVASYDLTPDGRVVTCNGSVITLHDAAGGSVTLGNGKLIERVSVIE